ncbi:hypothetical protein PR202_gb10095 [Eleusine coracana subsp. coracana]|uniref:glutathione-disulfide reductase n=1 Tax=Eleusine coracana subsp. coracana TaxID=191504 RepID=A0AAV5EJU5_ELECO|nr:hypothetical protein PR202_gb10095 [Eleusine coracana subsp. coracana]
MARKMLKDGDVPMADGEQFDYDLFVIGAGSGGVRGSRTAASFGAKVAICELPFHPISSEWLGGHGGTCVIRGCVPKKILVYGSSFKGEFEDAKNFGWEINGDINFNWKTLLENKELAITSDEALSLEELPKRAVILGGGYIAVEFASIWKGMGAQVDLFYRKDLPLRGFDDEMRTVVASNLEGRGIRLHPGTSLSELSKTADGIKVVTDKGEELIADDAHPNSQRLNLDAVGVEVDQIGAIKVDEYSCTSVPNVWAVGDVTNRINLTPVALMEATCFAKSVFGGQPIKPDHRDVPCAVFSEQEAVNEAKSDVLVFTSSFNPMKNSISKRQEKTIMKLLVDSETDKVLGASMCGPDAPEIIQGIAIALKCGATKATFDSTVGIHPSAAEEFVTMRTVTRRVSPASKPKM